MRFIESIPGRLRQGPVSVSGGVVGRRRREVVAIRGQPLRRVGERRRGRRGRLRRRPEGVAMTETVKCPLSPFVSPIL
jgi:hypothetical protein